MAQNQNSFWPQCVASAAVAASTLHRIIKTVANSLNDGPPENDSLDFSEQLEDSGLPVPLIAALRIHDALALIGVKVKQQVFF